MKKRLVEIVIHKPHHYENCYRTPEQLPEAVYLVLARNGIPEEKAKACAEWCATAPGEDSYNEENFDVYLWKEENTVFTIKSTSDEGIYYLVNGWNKHKTFWISEADVQKDVEKAKDLFFDSISTAKTSLKKLLKVMPDYASDTFEEVVF